MRVDIPGSTDAAGSATSARDTSGPPEYGLDRLVRLAARTLRVPVAYLTLLDERGDILAAGEGLPATWMPGQPLLTSDSPLRRLQAHGGPVVVPNAVVPQSQPSSPTLAGLSLAAYLILPVSGDGGRLLGALAAGDLVPREWTTADTGFLEDLAGAAAAVIQAREVALAAEQRAGLLAREVQHARLRTEERVRRLAENSQDIIFRYELGSSRGYSYVSPSVAGVLGYSQQDFYADPDLAVKIALPEDRGELQRAARGEYVATEALVRVKHKDGRTIWLDMQQAPLRDVDGNLAGFEGIARDVTQLMRTAEALRFSEQRFRELFDSAQRQAQELALLDQVRTALTRELDVSRIFKTVVEAIAEIFGYTQVSIYLVEEDELVMQHQVGYDRVLLRVPVSEGVMGRVVRTGAPELIEDVAREPEFLRAVEGIASEVCVPLFDQHRVVGVLNVESSTGAGLSEPDLRLMTALSEQVSIAIDRARLYTAARENEKKYRSVVDSVTEVIFQADVAGLWTFLNPAWQGITGFDVQQSIGTGMIHYIHLDDRERQEAEFRALVERRKAHSRYEVRCQTRGMGLRWLEVRARPLASPDGSIAGISGTLTDVTDRKLAEEALLRHNEELAALHETTLGLINQLDVTSLLEAVLTRAAALMGTPHGFLYVLDPGESEMTLRLGTGVFETVTGTRLQRGNGLSGHVWESGEPAAVEDYPTWPGRLPELEHLGVLAVAGMPLRSGAEIVGVLGLAYVEEGITFGAEDIALLTRFGQLASLALENARLYAAAQQELIERKRAEERLAYMAMHDPLTGLPNRTLLHDRLLQAILNSRRDGEPMALLVMDVDRFKEVNDTLGHHVGDELLQQIGSRLRDALRASDTVARLGGDEFAVLLPGADAGGATLAARKLLAVMEQPFTLEDQPLEVRMSIGIALLPDHGADQEVLLRRADVAMYLAKRSGVGFAFYSPDQDPYSPGRLALAGELRKAIEQDELVLYYQPKIAGGLGRVTGAEALVRWLHPQRGMLPPDQFIPLAEHTGLIGFLSQWVLGSALAQCRLWRELGLTLPVAVNLSMRDLHDVRLPFTVQKLLETWGVDPALLTVEITEDAVMSDLGGTLEVLTRLRDIGVRLAIDDFGTGQSSLAQLKRLPVDQLKIDKSFVREMSVNENDAVIVRSMIDLGHNLGLLVVAEGVEDQQTWNLLAELGCDEAQGYHLSLPLPAGDFVRWLRAHGE